MYKLIIAEKNSVGKSIADLLGAKARKGGHLEGNGYIVSWCVGHLLGLAQPQAYDAKYEKWRYEDLPIAPKDWKYTANPNTKKQLKVLSDLLKRADVDCVINACDAGREGELIFRLVYNHCNCNKPIQRLWISSMEESAIANGFRSLRPGADYEQLYHSALCRAQADWLVGMNCSRMYSVLYNAQLRVGRVQTPTLAMIVEREQKISAFVKEPFYVVEITDGRFIAEREKVKDRQTAENISSACVGKSAVVTSVQHNEKSVSAPKLYDLTTLQREANRLFGYTATQTLSCVQNLYEQRILTYPRTDSRFLTEDMAPGIPALVDSIVPVMPFAVNVENINVSPIIKNAGVTDHHAIIPTPTMPGADLSALPTAERNILNMVATRLISAVSEKHVYSETVVTIECDGETFAAKGKTIVQDGWKAVETDFLASVGKQKKDTDKALPDIVEGFTFGAKTSIREGFSQPPKHFTEDLLLSAMETAGAKSMQSMDYDMLDDAERKGLGTPATRANIIETLVKSGFLERKDKTLLPTDKGVNLIKILPDSVKSPLLTAEWENHLLRIEKSDMTADDFMISINKFISGLVQANNNPSAENMALFPANTRTGDSIGKCPRCNGNITESTKGFFCDNKPCKFALFKDSKFFTSKKKTLTKDLAKTLLTEGRIFMSNLHSEKTSKTYSATIILDDTGDGYPGFKIEFEQKKGAKK